MNNFKNTLLYYITALFIIILLAYQFILNYNSVPAIDGPNEAIILIGAYGVATVLIYQILKGIVVSDKSTLIRNITILFAGNCMIYAVLFFTNSNLNYSDFFNTSALQYFIGYFIFSVCASFMGSNIFYQYRKEIRTNGYHRYVIRKYLIQAVVANLFLYFVFTQLVNPFFTHTIFYPHVMNYALIGVITILFLSIFYFLEKKRQSFEKEIIKETTKAETATANFETLKNQLDPHFLFNSLNVLTGLIEENPEKAVDFTTSLSKIYRYLLEQKDKQVVPLAEEIKFAKTYINLLKLRFENAIDFNLEIQDFSDNEFIVPLSLQILLENTIKHNIVTESKPLKIRIYKENQHLIVENSLQLKTSVKDSTGVGINNIKNRYLLLSHHEVVISNENNLFKVELPILTPQIMNSINHDHSEDFTYDQAKNRAIALRKFYQTLIRSTIAFGVCAIVNIVSYNGYWWCLWVLFGVGVDCINKAAKLYQFDENWENRKAKEILEKNNQNKK